MDVDMNGLPVVISSGLGCFLALMTTVRMYRESSKVENKQSAVLQQQVDFLRVRAENAEKQADEAQGEARADRERLNKLISDQSDMKAQNLTMIEQLKALREENGELKQQIQNFMRAQNARA